MKKTKFILPIIALLSLSSCGSKEPVKRETNKGEIPTGGTLASGDVQKKVVGAVLAKSRTSISELEEFGLVASSEGLNLDLKSEYLNGTVNLGNFTLNAGASNLFSGNKENTKIGLDFSGLKCTADLHSAGREDVEDFDVVADRTIGKCAAYLENGNVYVDLAEFGVPEVVNKAATYVEPYLPVIEEAFELDEMTTAIINYLVAEFVESPENVTATIAPFFGVSNPDNFNYKFAFEDVLSDENYPLVSPEDVIPEGETESLVEQYLSSFDELTGLKHESDLLVYEYDDGAVALQVNLGKEELAKVLDKYTETNFDYVINDGSLKAALYIDSKGIPASFSLVNDLDLTLSGEEVETRYGETLDVKLDVDFNLSLLDDKNPVEFPENYKDFNSLSSLIGMLGFLN